MPIEPKDATIIVIEDNADNLFIVENVLRIDLKVKYWNGRASGRQFFKLLETNTQIKPDLILLDLQIPYEDGYKVCSQIRATPRLMSTKVVALTANVMPDDVERVREAGFDGFIGKPINLTRFPTQITRILADESVWEPR